MYEQMEVLHILLELRYMSATQNTSEGEAKLLKEQDDVEL